MVSCSIILPSRNGADTLPLVLEALGRLDGLTDEVEILLVDNCSTDETAALMREFAVHHRATTLSESRPGKSHALNTAIEASSGDLLLFLDDDAIPKRSWLTSYLHAFESLPEAGAFAGSVRPYWAASPPDWLKGMADEGRACGCTRTDRRPGPIEPEQIKGANFAVRRIALGDLRFDVETVNFGGNKVAIGGEDSMMAKALAARGHSFSFYPDAEVAHVIGADEMALRFQLGRFARIGRGNAAISKLSFADQAYALAKTAAYAMISAGRLAAGRKTSAAVALSAAAMNYGTLSASVTRLFDRSKA